MKSIDEFIILPLSERQAHLRLNESCVFRGGTFDDIYTSVYSKGLLAHILDTTIPRGHKIHLCHACHNGKCGNPYHMYWGTVKENCADAKANGRKSIWQCLIEKHGTEKAHEIVRERSSHSSSVLAAGMRRESLEQQRAKEALTDARKIAERNSQYGTCWIKKEGKELRIKTTNLGSFLIDGWKRGRTTPIGRIGNGKSTTLRTSLSAGSSPAAPTIL